MQRSVSGWCSCFASPISARKHQVVHVNPQELSRNNWLPLLHSSRGSLHQHWNQPSRGASWASIERLLIQSSVTFYSQGNHASVQTWHQLFLPLHWSSWLGYHTTSESQRLYSCITPTFPPSSFSPVNLCVHEGKGDARAHDSQRD